MRLVLRSTLVPYTTLFRSGLAQRGGPVAPFAQLRADPDADVDLAAGELAEHHPDLLGALDRDEPGGLLVRSEEHTSELQSRGHLVCRLLLEKNNVCESISL